MSELRKSVQEGLRAGEPANVHPDADVLTGYCEDLLTSAEREQVLSHLAACADCREIVSLAGAAVPEPEAQAAYAAARPSLSRWSLAAVATLALFAASAGVYYFEIRDRNQIASRTNSTDGTTRQKTPAPAVQDHEQAKLEPLPSPPSSVRERQTNNAPHKDASREEKARPPAVALPESRPTQTPPSDTDKSREAASASAVAASAKQKQPDITQVAPLSGLSKLQVPASSDAGVSNNAATAQPKSTPNAASSQTVEIASSPQRSNAKQAYAARESATGLARARAHWRISKAGVIERSVVQGQWTSVLNDSHVQFRVVSIFGANVWAGGANGELYHSRDDGDTWTKVPLETRSAITSIRFDTEQRGTLETSDGDRWTTTNSGETWSRQ